MNAPYNNITGAILAGGYNTRMGREKAFINIGQKRIIDNALEVFNRLFNEVIIVTNDRNKFSEFKDIKVVEDLIRDSGPLGGIYTGLKASSSDKVFFIACDMPFLHNDFIKRLLDISYKSNADCIVPISEKRIEPLHALYSKNLVSKLEHLINKGELSINMFIKDCNTVYIEAKTDELSSFVNLNSPEDVKRLGLHENKI